MIDAYRFLDKNKLTEHARTMKNLPVKKFSKNKNEFILYSSATFLSIIFMKYVQMWTSFAQYIYI